jgi:hypothetical protein
MIGSVSNMTENLFSKDKALSPTSSTINKKYG